MEIISITDEERLAHEAAAALSAAFEKNFGGEFLLLVTPVSDLDFLSLVDQRFLGGLVTIGVSTEHYGVPPEKRNSARLVRMEFAEIAKSRGCHFVNISATTDEGVAQLGEQWSRWLKEWREKNPNGTIILVDGLVGDRIAGIPSWSHSDKDAEKLEKKFFDTDAWAAGFESAAHSDFPMVVTVTFPFLRMQVDEAIIYVKGLFRGGTLDHITDPEGSLSALPARIVREMKSVRVFTDRPVED